MTYDDAIRWVRTLPDFERTGNFADRPDLAPMQALLAQLGDPHLGRATIHIAGSKGKGSTGIIAEAIMAAAGARPGFYLSPHLHRYNERIRIDREPIERETFGAAMTAVRGAVDEVAPQFPQRQFLAFDVLTAAAFVSFRDAEVDVQVVEVGLGGTLDSTNVFGPQVTRRMSQADETEVRDTRGAQGGEAGTMPPHVVVITPVSLEHVSVLGDTIAAIAAQKAGIITAGSTVVVAPQRESALDVVRARAAEAGAEVIEVAGVCKMSRTSAGIEGQDFKLQTASGKYAAHLPLAGRHQLENAATAIVACETLQAKRGAELAPAVVEQAIVGIAWPARLEVLKRKPLVIIDGAHNGDSAKRLAAALRDDFGLARATFIVGTLADKNVAAMVSAVAPFADQVFVPSWPHSRAAEPSSVTDACRKADVPVTAFADLAQAYEAAAAAAGERGAVVAFGAIAFVAQLREYLLGIESDMIRLALASSEGANRG